MLLVPAVQAILVQSFAFLAVLMASVVFALIVSGYFGFNLHMPVIALVILQALLAAIFSQLIGMASWWRWIHFCFPIAILSVSYLHVPNQVYLIGFVVSLSLFWTTFRTQVPFFPSTPNVWFHVSKLILSSQNQSARMIDIGSGFGGMAMHIAKVCPTVQVEGMEIAPLPWFFSWLRAHIRRSSAIFRLGDYGQLNFANYDVIFAYLSPVAMHDLWEKAQQEMVPDSVLISYEFEIEGVAPTLVVPTGDKSPMLYIWKIH